VAVVGEMIKAYKMLVGKSEGNKVLWTHRGTHKNYIKMGLKEM
jgi:hypothetical protein